jgi:hypothetical protein
MRQSPNEMHLLAIVAIRTNKLFVHVHVHAASVSGYTLLHRSQYSHSICWSKFRPLYFSRLSFK